LAVSPDTRLDRLLAGAAAAVPVEAVVEAAVPVVEELPTTEDRALSPVAMALRTSAALHPAWVNDSPTIITAM
jgi:hypothetical protein